MTSSGGPERKCVGCGSKRAKALLRRLAVDTSGTAALDLAQRADGRGAYVCGVGCLVTAAKKKALGRAFRGRMTVLNLDSLAAELEALRAVSTGA